MELFPENSVMFTINNLEHFIKPFLENPVDEYKRIGLFVFFSFRTPLRLVVLLLFVCCYYCFPFLINCYMHVYIICYVPVLHAL